MFANIVQCAKNSRYNRPKQYTCSFIMALVSPEDIFPGYTLTGTSGSEVTNTGDNDKQDITYTIRGTLNAPLASLDYPAEP